MGKTDNDDTDPSKAVLWLDDDGIVHIRNSERGTFAKCQQRWWWSWREGLRPKETPKALWFGTAVHEALADYYQPGLKRSTDYIDKFIAYADMEGEYVRTNIGALDEEAWVDAKTLGVQMLKGYHDEYGGDRNWDVVGTEQAFALRIPWLKQPKGKGSGEQSLIQKELAKLADFETDYFILNGTLDGVYRDLSDKRFKIMEHKTAASISFGHLTMDNQAGTYWMVAPTVGVEQGWFKKGDNIREITYNFLRKGMPDLRPRDDKGYCTNKPGKDAFIEALDDHVIWPVGARGGVKYPTIPEMEAKAASLGITVLGERSKSQPPPLYMRHPVRRSPQQRRMQLSRLQDEVTAMAMFVVGFQPVTKSAGRDTCPMCPYKEMCELHESGADWQGFRDALFRVEDLYVEHRKSA